jgi:archaellum component FlaF (FlaF/FlaG flagellin family)
MKRIVCLIAFLGFFGVTSTAQAQTPTIKIAKLNAYANMTNIGIKINMDIVAAASTEYQVRIEAATAGKATLVLDVIATKTLANGKISPEVNYSMSALLPGTKYTITVKLFPKGADTSKGTPLATDKMDVTTPALCGDEPSAQRRLPSRLTEVICCRHHEQSYGFSWTRA